jgi:hypothetical protein
MPHNYGLISQTDANVIEKILDIILEQFKGEDICVTELGVFDGQTARGIRDYLISKKSTFCYVAVDNEKDKLIKRPFDSCNFIRGNSDEVCYKIQDSSQHFIFVDACHCFAHVVSDFFCYSPKVKPCGYLLFHDTGAHIKPFKDFQHGSRSNPDAFISVRKALAAIGMFMDEGNHGFKIIMDEYDPNDEAGGVIVFQKSI